MQRNFSLIWIALILLLLLPTSAGRILLDLAGGLMLASFLIPILLTGLGWIGWKILQSKMVICDGCGTRSFGNVIQCPMCGSTSFSNTKANNSGSNDKPSVPASSATIDVKAENVD